MSFLSSCLTTFAFITPLLCHVLAIAGTAPPEFSSSTARRRVLVLDVDGTLYTEKAQVESQIIKGIHDYVQQRYGLTPTESDALHHKHGSTIDGLVAEGKVTNEQELADFYREAYKNIDYSGIYSAEDIGDATGYSHSLGWKGFLKALPFPKYIASNSPTPHVQAVLRSLGLADVEWDGVLTPDTVGTGYPTKISRAYWAPLLDNHNLDEDEVILIDDSSTNVEVAGKLGMKAIQVGPALGLERALCAAAGLVPPPWEEQGPHGAAWAFDPLAYLRAKNAEDARARSPAVWARLADELGAALAAAPAAAAAVVYDLGAGLLPLLPAFQRLLLLLAPPAGGEAAAAEGAPAAAPGQRPLSYHAWETEGACLGAVRAQLLQDGYSIVKESDSTTVFNKDSTTIHLHAKDFAVDQDIPAEKPHVIVGCCLADLFEPSAFARAVARLARGGGGSGGGGGGGTLVYLPITFAGATRFVPAAPREGAVPGDAEGFAAYHAALASHGHHLRPAALRRALRAHGAAPLAEAPSRWEVARAENPTLWESLLYFFGLNAGPRLLAAGRGDDAAGWVRRARLTSPAIEADNVDYLFRFGGPHQQQMEDGNEDAASCAPTEDVIRYVEFVGEKKVAVRTEELPGAEELGEDRVLIRTERSMISTGTELKIFRGEFEEDAVVDTTFKDDEKMGFPLRYGYCLVGKVTAAGSGAEAQALLGRRVFTFAPHQSHVVAAAGGVFPVPAGLAPEDAVYLPAVETALSVVQDARPAVGEAVAVVGQGLIGLLVTAVLGASHGAAAGGKVIAVDIVQERLKTATEMGATHTATPDEFKVLYGEADTTIEMSGNFRGLQFAVDNTGYGGTVIIGSWYGSEPAQLSLGLNFHRSHLKLKSSQVSNVPAALTDRWTKARRFAAAWELVRELRPSRHITSRVAHVSEAQEMYERLLAGQELGVQFTYH